jgi:transketolase
MERKEGYGRNRRRSFLPFKRSYLSSFYSVLASGYFPVSELATFRLINSRLQGHPTTHDNLPGVRIHLVHLDKVYL